MTKVTFENGIRILLENHCHQCWWQQQRIIECFWLLLGGNTGSIVDFCQNVGKSLVSSKELEAAGENEISLKSEIRSTLAHMYLINGIIACGTYFGSWTLNDFRFFFDFFRRCFLVSRQ